jgi:hypothetical protein
LKQLADRTIDKVNNRADNERISEIFNVFSLMMYYQHGVGKSKLSFNKVLDPAAYKNLMVRASQQFQNNYLNNESLSRVLAVVSNQARFKNYLVDVQGFRNKEYANTVVPVSKDSFEVPANFTPGKRVVFEEDVNAFLDRVSKNGGKKPNKHFTVKSTFSAFYNNGTGKREPMPQSAIWVLNDNGLYDMIDQDPESGEVYYQNVDLTTGLQMIVQEEGGEGVTLEKPSNLPGPETTINIYAGKGENAELSNFAYRPFTVPAGNVTLRFNTVEGAYQAAKLGRTNSFLETKKLTPAQEKILEKLQTATGAEAKKIGQAIKDLNKEKFTSFYAGKVEEKLANGEQEVFIQFPASEMKPLHAQWTADSLQYVATQQQWMENAFRGVGLWDIRSKSVRRYQTDLNTSTLQERSRLGQCFFGSAAPAPGHPRVGHRGHR